ncbi:hypothetical protein ABW636_09865 [Aquimarina sp. 2201CG1-2-11]|uniref:hypothetical protein n=1 Tax=Aquimarina discodermiae TaxID=3231043 RepID=UPI003461AB18
MKKIKTLITVALMVGTTVSYAQTDQIEDKENSSEEIVTKTIRIKGANGEEKVIKKQEVITKKSKIKLNPDDDSKTNQAAVYTDEEVSVQKSMATTNMGTYTITPDTKGHVMTFSDIPEKKAKVRPLSNSYYVVNFGDKDNCIGHFDADKNFVLEMYNETIDQVIAKVYKAN